MDFQADGQEVRRCLHCDGDVAADWRSVTATELSEHGYEIVHARGCGNGGGCSSGCGMRARV